MSAFLGPIHFWLYKKIQFQEALIDELVAYARVHNWSAEDLADKYCTKDRRELEEVIDEVNIHGWLQSRIHDAEGRYAAFVNAMVEGHAERLEELKQAAYDFGKNQGVSGETAPAVYHQLDDLLLDGMPCDMVNQVVDSTDERFVWQQAMDIHSSFWGDNGAYYYALRQAMIKGLLAGTDFAFTQEADGAFVISRKAA